MVILISSISIITTIIGLYYVSEKLKAGFIYYTISLLCQAILFAFQKNWLLVLQMLVLICSNMYVFWKWRKDEKRERI